MNKIIGIQGLIGSGKGATSDYLVEHHGFEKLSFADKLKDTVSELFDYDREMLEGDTAESRNWREQQDSFWSKELGKAITPRYILQVFGTDCMRNGFHDNIWISIVKKKILENPDTKYVMPDLRFFNEVEAIKALGGTVVSVERGELPTWWEHAVEYKTRSGKKDASLDSIHISEWDLAGYDFDKIIKNDGTLNELYEQVKLLI